jgi:hypothetical protein
MLFSRTESTRGPQNTASAMLQWLIDHNVLSHVSDTGKTAHNIWIESFNARVRDEFLSVQAFRPSHRSVKKPPPGCRAWIAATDPLR